MHIIESSWKNPDGVTLYTRKWQPDGRTRAVVILVHGLGEHCARYDHLAEVFTQHGIQVSSFDLPGHGRSQGIRGHIPSYDQAAHIIDHFIQDASSSSGLPIFLYGHSLGGALAIYFAITQPNQLKGVICTSPGLDSAEPLPPAKLVLAKVLYRLAPKVTIPNGLYLEGLSRDPEVVRSYKADPLVTEQVSARLGLEIINKGAWIVEHANQVNLPLLLMLASPDRLVSVAATRKFAEGVPKQFLTYKEWKGIFHELHNEPEKDQVFQEILGWIANQIGEKSLYDAKIA